MKAETIPFRDFMNGSWKKPKQVSNLLPAVAFVPNEPTTFMVTMLGIGLVVLIAEHCLQDTDYAEKIRIFRSRYIKYAFPVCVAATGVYVFIKVVNILL
ncbi:hypothetical protein BED47_00860 [Gottfriedia luciferensis]|uniref:Uncharacterized protein n=1 Tax=Gottfriedia luciferensis TaxID=178774 RepID=A0ABX2ZVE2_9BACI|nr:hypothetical protein [Gottfriedia luciferensis]ODG93751.1 hypothetical protein BED47_00860 [Gottfriedia luciferensis]